MFKAKLKKRGLINIGKKEFIEPAKVAAIRLIGKCRVCLPVDLHKLAEELRIKIHYEKLPANCDGWTLELLPDFTSVNYLILINSNRFAVRQRFTIAHEIGHVVLNHFDRKPNACLFKNIEVKDNFEFEREADIFASELLIPTPHLLKLVKEGKANDIKRLCSFYGVSKKAMEIKLEEIKRGVRDTVL